MSAQGSTTSESETVTLETQDSTSNVTDVSELSENASRTGFTTPKRICQVNKYFAVTIGRKPGVYTDPDEYDRQINGFENAKAAKFETKEQAEAYIE